LGRRPERVSRSVHIAGASEGLVRLVGRLMYLLDTNVWLGLLLSQKKAAGVRQFQQSIDADQFSMPTSTRPIRDERHLRIS
jgi:hypothetical protein